MKTIYIVLIVLIAIIILSAFICFFVLRYRNRKNRNNLPTETEQGLVSLQDIYDIINKQSNSHNKSLTLENATITSNLLNPYFNQFVSRELTDIILTNVKFMPSKYNVFTFFQSPKLQLIKLKNVTIPNLQSAGKMFSLCENLKTVELSNFDVSNVINMNNMFDGCISLTSLELSNFDTKNVTNMLGMFGGCIKLNALDLS